MKHIILYLVAAVTLVSCGGSQQATKTVDIVDRSQAPEAGPAPEIKLQKPETFTLDNGLQVIVVENHKLPTVTTSLYFDYPTIFEGDKAGVGSFYGNMMRAGTKNYTKEQLDEELDFYGISLGASSRSIGFSSLKKQMPKAVELMTEVLFNPTFNNSDVLNKLKKQQLTDLEASAKNTDAIMGRVANALVYGKDHPYGEYITEESVNNINLADFRNHYNTYFKPNIAYLTIVGDVTLAEAKEMAKANFSNWAKGTVPSKTYNTPDNVSQTEINIIDLPTATQSNIVITNLEDLQKSNKDYFASVLGNHLLGSGSSARLFQNLREDKGYTYGAYSSLGNDIDYPSRFNASAKVRNEVTDSAIIAFYDELNFVTKDKFGADKIKIARSEQTGRFALGLESPQTVASFARTIFMEDLPSDFYANYLKSLENETGASIQKAMNNYVKPNQQRIIIVGKAEDIADDVKALGYPVKFYDIWANEVADPTIKADVGDVNAESIIASSIKAQGGLEKLKAIKNMVANYGVDIPGLPAPAKATVKATASGKNSTVIEMEGMGPIIKIAYNGKTGYMEQMGQKMEMDEASLKNYQSTNPIFPILSLNSGNATVDNIVTIDGKKAYKLKVNFSNGLNADYFIDTDTYDIIQISTVADVEGQPISIVNTMSDFAEYNGIRYAKTMVTEQGPQAIKMKLNDLKFNETIADSVFE